MLGGSPKAALNWYRMATELDARDVLPAVRVPTLVVHRTDDRSVPVEAGRYLADHIPGARFAEFPGDDHFVYEGDAEPILQEIEEFLTGARRGPERARARDDPVYAHRGLDRAGGGPRRPSVEGAPRGA